MNRRRSILWNNTIEEEVEQILSTNSFLPNIKHGSNSDSRSRKSSIFDNKILDHKNEFSSFTNNKAEYIKVSNSDEIEDLALSDQYSVLMKALKKYRNSTKFSHNISQIWKQSALIGYEKNIQEKLLKMFPNCNKEHLQIPSERVLKTFKKTNQVIDELNYDFSKDKLCHQILFGQILIDYLNNCERKPTTLSKEMIVEKGRINPILVYKQWIKENTMIL